MFDTIKEFINPSKNPDLTQAHEFQRQNLSTLWLLGKTGAGKSSLIQAITGLSSVEVGNGFEPCTMTASAYDFPQGRPIMRFLDTRGLSEADYNPKKDLETLGKTGHALVVVMKVDEPEQSAVVNALEQIKKQKKVKHLLVVHTAVLSASDKDRERQVAFNQQKIEAVWGKHVESVAVDFEADDGSVHNYDQLLDKLASILPIIGMVVEDKEHSTLESENFDKLENEILWYCGSASASDLLPAVGLVSVPAIQAKMLHSLANQYGVEWNKQTFSELIGTLGSSFAFQYGVKLGARQLIKFVPVYGQTVGAVAAAALSFGTTYGLGRAACYYFYHKSKGESVSEQDMQDLYRDSMKKGKEASGYESD
ncbi:GTP-binding DUF697 domain-containing protein [Vibrio europaeus]|uniref:DUF697 domain-containing protein n=1 Tax=Vibrio europaeus TaxID=300876 RepID=A0AAE7DYI7_9VIBR|nr:GTPase [Vibrio europaeus]MDC5806363.1 GTP-binding DUF697 domain-containing protein [Vibrio europaeus]MDC5812676.1 GTP-binding DUF697 domain-containing protein [Vibrio europaeus]MDC5825791.1 GTP-binding DUF697 domain-containing protein [Vibrio europaeus]MDC5830928.1 GTP-binding DUF697 domain-containing protein [Vibrio europaeus]MDC5833883.1 GTP-binding DUF697 domain-containing protein [Vibrio europaeus]